MKRCRSVCHITALLMFAILLFSSCSLRHTASTQSQTLLPSIPSPISRLSEETSQFYLSCPSPSYLSEDTYSSVTSSHALPTSTPVSLDSPSDSSESDVISEDVHILTAEYKGIHFFANDPQEEQFLFITENGEQSFTFDPIFNTKEYALQNTLKVGYLYHLILKDGIVVSVEESPNMGTLTPVVTATPGENTIKNLLQLAMMPVGSTLYVYGGGWNWQDTGAGPQATSVGMPFSWGAFFEKQTSEYTYKGTDLNGTSYYPTEGKNDYYFAGLDCSGYLGWTLYNALNHQSGQEGLVFPSTEFAQSLASKGLGTVSTDLEKLSPGDIVSIKGHVWLCVGKCADGSVVIAHSTPSSSRSGFKGGGVQLSAIGETEDCEAYKLANQYMSKYFPLWYSRYPVMLCRPQTYLSFSASHSGIFSFDLLSDRSMFNDPEGVRSMTADQILSLIFSEDSEAIASCFIP